MEREIITISDSGTVSVPNDISMTISEIADLFNIYYQTAKQHIRSIEKSDIASGDYTLSCTVEGLKIHPDYYELEMIVAVAFRVKAAKAEIFRQWVCKRATQSSTHTVFTLLTQNAMQN